MSKLQPVRGTHDLYGDDMRRHRHVVEVARDIASRYMFEEIIPPIFEFTDVFARSMGETSDVVSKEMYSMTDKGGENITLRPELTAGLCRAVISEGMAQNAPLKFFSHGPVFRYERPQKGRQRQFHQIDVEIIGVESPVADVESISLGARILDALGIFRRCTLEINTLGDMESRKNYRGALVKYFTSHKDQLSEDSLKRLEKNPMRILDSKDEGDKRLVASAPDFSEYLNEPSKDFFAKVKDGLTAVNIPFKINTRLVRGLDYYCHTAFEFITSDLGAQGTVMGGGRYDGLIESLGGPKLAGIGWGAGIERLAMLLEYVPMMARPVAIVPVSENEQAFAATLADDLRRAGIAVDMGYSGNVGKRMKRAGDRNARFAVIIGGDEIKSGQAQVRNMDSGEEKKIAFNQLQHFLK
ncbi:MAG: histidine--tRNA ligase [Alphaproteobacteria bacterium]|nr:MAG: histidine--tRNA ligase [Alphaproteobacteria bacterium]